MTLAAFPLGTRVRVLPLVECIDPDALSTVGKVGTVTAHDDPGVCRSQIAEDGEPAPWGANGFPLYPNEIEALTT